MDSSCSPELCVSLRCSEAESYRRASVWVRLLAREVALSSLTDLKGEILVIGIQGAGNDPIGRGALLDVWPETGNSNQLWQGSVG